MLRYGVQYKEHTHRSRLSGSLETYIHNEDRIAATGVDEGDVKQSGRIHEMPCSGAGAASGPKPSSLDEGECITGGHIAKLIISFLIQLTSSTESTKGPSFGH